MKFNKLTYAIGLMAVVVFFTSCDKTKPYETDIPPALAHFVGAKVQSYDVLVDPAPTFNLVIGTTDVANVDRTISFNITSPSGAVEGVDYIINGGSSGTVTIPAGKAVDTIRITAVASRYLTLLEKDTLIFKITQPNVEPAQFLNTVTLVIKPPCGENQMNILEMEGDYTNTIEVYGNGSPYGPYTTNVSGAVSTGPTSGSLKVKNVYDVSPPNGTGPWGDIEINLDWSDINNRTVLVVDGVVPNSDAGDVFGATYAGNSVAIRQHGGGLGTFSYCDQSIQMRMNLGVAGVGFSSTQYRVTLNR